METKAKSPFAAGIDHTTACVNFMGDMNCGYTEGYRLAARLLATHVENQNTDHDFLVYPICYLYRHHLELQIKQIIRTGRRLLDKDGDVPPHHKLADLWPLAKSLIREAEPNQPDPSEFRAVDTFIRQFASVDYDAQAFRFPTKSKSSGGGRSLDGVTHISLTGLRDVVEPLASFLWGCDSWLSEILQFKYEMEQEYGP